MSKKTLVLILLSVLLLAGDVPIGLSHNASFPLTYDPTTFVVDSIADPDSLDPAWAYEATYGEPFGAVSYSQRAATSPVSGRWSRDANRNKIDDMIEERAGSFDVFVHYDRHPSTADVATLSSCVNVSNIYKYIDVVAVRNVPKEMLWNLSTLSHVVKIEWQGFAKPALDISVPAVKASQSAIYSPDTAWDLGYFGENVKIAVLDTGVDNLHESFMFKFVAGYDATPPGSLGIEGDPDDTSGHGTHVAGTALGIGGLTQTYAGVAPFALLIDVKVLPGFADDLIEGIEWVVDNTDADIINLSLSIVDENGIDIPSDGTDAVCQAANYAADAGIVVVAAVGNSGASIIPAPAAADKAIAVGAIDDMSTIDRGDDVKAGFSNVGPRMDDGDADAIDELKPDVVAPGVKIMAPRFNTADQYWEKSGTSMATPHVSGIVALMLEQRPHLTPDRVKRILRASAEDRDGTFNPLLDPKYDQDYGCGLVDAYKTLMDYTSLPISDVISNVYETLTSFSVDWAAGPYNAGKVDQFTPKLATSWSVVSFDPPLTSPQGLPIYSTWTFKIRTSVKFHFSGNGLTPADVEYSFERLLVQDRVNGPSFTLYEPLLNEQTAKDPATDPDWGLKIDYAIQSNATHVWFNLASPFATLPFLRTLSLPWSSVVEKAWASAESDLDIDTVSGGWSNWQQIWDTWHDPPESFLEDAILHTQKDGGTGPYMMDYWFPDVSWSILRFSSYWGGWPALVNPLGHERIGGYVERVTWLEIVDWSSRRSRFLVGDADFTHVPDCSPYIDQVLGQIVSGEYVHCFYPLPSGNKRHFEQWWVRGWYFNPVFPWNNFYHLWKAKTHYGDSSNDGEVDIRDIAAVSAHWTGPPAGPMSYNPIADIMGGTGDTGYPVPGTVGYIKGIPDGKVDIVDAALVSAYWDAYPTGPSHP